MKKKREREWKKDLLLDRSRIEGPCFRKSITSNIGQILFLASTLSEWALGLHKLEI